PLEAWQRSIMEIVRREAYYFSPQRMTKIMNEGWACYWHSKLLTGGLLDASEILDFADAHSGATASQPGQLNPYKLGIELFRFADECGEDIFRLRSVHNDVSLIDKLADESFTERFLRSPEPASSAMHDEQMEAPPTWREVKAQTLHRLSWGGLPQIELTGIGATGELLLIHRHDGRDLQLGETGETLKCMAGIWQAPVHLLTLEDGQGRLVIAADGQVTVSEADSAQADCRTDSAA
ncbi:MAG: stage V sporulation protein R, partial [Planctomycetota bacterium]